MKNASAVEWRQLPNGEVGILPPAVAGPGDRTQVMEEGHIVPLNSGRGWYMVARGSQVFTLILTPYDSTQTTGCLAVL